MWSWTLLRRNVEECLLAVFMEINENNMLMQKDGRHCWLSSEQYKTNTSLDATLQLDFIWRRASKRWSRWYHSAAVSVKLYGVGCVWRVLRLHLICLSQTPMQLQCNATNRRTVVVRRRTTATTSFHQQTTPRCTAVQYCLFAFLWLVHCRGTRCQTTWERSPSARHVQTTSEDVFVCFVRSAWEVSYEVSYD